MSAKVTNNNTEVRSPLVLAIESSCDDTSAAVLRGNKVLSNIVANQEIHHEFGGVVPELASREHQKNIVPVVDRALAKAGINQNDLDAIAFTEGPGLMGSLLVGGSFAKTFALSLGIPLIAVDHMKAHILAHFIDEGETVPEFPFLSLTVSGGHTQIVFVEEPLKMTVIGKTIDDAAGEAFDKAAKILNLGYPGGPMIDKLAQEGDASKFTYATPNTGGFDFSFSGIKTSFLYHLQKEMKSNPDFISDNLTAEPFLNPPEADYYAGTVPAPVAVSDPRGDNFLNFFADKSALRTLILVGRVYPTQNRSFSGNKRIRFLKYTPKN